MSGDVYDLCIIGAGMFGSAAARYASANPCLRVCLIGPTEPNDTEKNNREIYSSHYDEGRIVRHGFKSLSLQELAKQTIDRFRELEKLSGMMFYNPVGCIVTKEKLSDAFYMSREVDVNSEIPSALDLSFGDVFRKRFPFLRMGDEDYPIFDDNGAGYVSPRKLLQAQIRVALLQGCDLILEVVETVSEPINGLHSIVTEYGRELKSKRVLFCTGAFTKFKNFGTVNNLKMTVHKETAAMIRVKKDESERLSGMPAMIVYKKELGDSPATFNGAYILPPIYYPDGNYYLKIGHIEYPKNSELSTLEEIKEWCIKDDGDPLFIEQYSKFLLEMVSDLKAEDIGSKTCVTCTNPTGLPYIDRISPTVTVAVVGNGIGVTISDEVGRIASHLSLTGQWDSKLSKVLFEAILEEQKAHSNGRM